MNETITIVSGLPRSGTSMMMKMLDAGGIEPAIDHVREADIDNPKGYYELEIAKKIKDDVSWLPDTKGKAFKMVSMLLSHLPDGHRYKVVFMRREMPEILASQNKMLERLGQEGTGVPDEQMAAMFEKHLSGIQEWLRERTDIDVLYVRYGNVMNDPSAEAARIAQFLERPLDESAMAAVVDPTLYRNKA